MTSDSTKRPLLIDLFAGAFGWSRGWLELGGRAIGFDIDHQDYHGPVPYGAELVLQDVRTIDGARFKDASLIVASPPCQEFSYMAMPWKRAKQIAQALYARQLCDDGPPFPAGYIGSRSMKEELTALFDACFRIQREAIAAAGHHIPLVVENVRGAQPWVGRSRWHHGSFHLFGDVPALMPIVGNRQRMKSAVDCSPRLWSERTATTPEKAHAFHYKLPNDAVKIGGPRGDDWFTHHNRDEFDDRATKNDGGSWFNVAHNTTSGTGQNPDGRKTQGHVNIRDGYDHTRHLMNQAESDGVKQPGISGERDNGKGDRWFQDGAATFGSKSSARKAASARIAKIPLALARWIAKAYYPKDLG